MTAPTKRDDAVRRPIRRSVRQVVWIAFLLGVGICLTVLQLDRESLRRPGLAMHVPQAAGSFALPLLVQQDLQSGDAEAALASARQLVELRPLPAENLSILAMAAASAQLPDIAIGALELSSGRGWREPLAQAAAARSALDAGDAVAAAQRTIALWSVGRRDQTVGALFTEISASDQGRAELDRWLIENQLARDSFLSWSAENLPPATVAHAISGAIARGVDFDCRNLARVVYQIMRRGDAAASAAMWQGKCATSGAGPQDVNFHPRSSDVQSLFGWDTMNGAGFQYADAGKANPDSGDWMLTYDNGKPGWTVIAVRISALPPGAYTASVRVPKTNVSSLPVEMRVACIAGNGDRLSELARIRANEPAELQIPPERCDVQHYGIFAPRGQGEITAASLTPMR